MATSIRTNARALELSAKPAGLLEMADPVAEEVEETEEAVLVELEGGSMTETVLSFTSATKTSPFAESYATAKGPDPAGMVARTESVESEITVTVLSCEFATKTSPFEGS
jgi:hypothetical protein